MRQRTVHHADDGDLERNLRIPRGTGKMSGVKIGKYDLRMSM
jgi:hypothetical protein